MLNFYAIFSLALLMGTLRFFWQSEQWLGKFWKLKISRKAVARGFWKSEMLAGNFLVDFLMGLILGIGLLATGAATVTDGLVTGLLIWPGFFFLPGFIQQLREGQAWKLFWTERIFYLTWLIMSAIILSIWRI